jgi:hypothetical protein
MLLRPSPISSRLFDYDKNERCFVAEISDLGPGFEFHRVYDDACDVGLTVISHRSGREVVFAVDEVETDREGDILAWRLVPASYQRALLIDNVTMTIFND